MGDRHTQQSLSVPEQNSTPRTKASKAPTPYPAVQQLYALSSRQGSSVSILATAWAARIRFPSDSSLIPIHTMPIVSWIQPASFGVAIRNKSEGTWSCQLASIKRRILQCVWCLTSCSLTVWWLGTRTFAFSVPYQVTYRINDRHTNKLKTLVARSEDSTMAMPEQTTVQCHSHFLNPEPPHSHPPISFRTWSPPNSACVLVVPLCSSVEKGRAHTLRCGGPKHTDY